MYKIHTASGKFLGYCEDIRYIKVKNGVFVSADAGDAVGVAMNSKAYNLPGHSEIPGAEEAVVTPTTLNAVLDELEEAHSQTDADMAFLSMMTGVDLDLVEAHEEEGDVSIGGSVAEEGGEVTLPGDTSVTSDKFETVKGYYESGLWDEARVNAAVSAGWITAGEAEDIIGA